MATFLTDMTKKGYTQDEAFAVVFESEREKKCRRVQAIVTETVDAHRLRKMRDLLAFEKLATWRRMNGFDRVVEGEKNWFHGHRSLPLTPEQYTVSLRSELQKLKNAISMPAEPAENRPWQKTMDCVDGLKGKLPDEELAVIKQYVEKRSREAAQAQVTVTPVDAVQHCSPCPLDPNLRQVYVSSWRATRVRWTRSEASSNHHRLVRVSKRPDSSVPRTRGYETGRTTAAGFLTADVGSSQAGNISSPTERAKSTATLADISSPTEHVGTLAGAAATPEKRMHISEENTHFDPGGKGEKAPPWNAAVTLLSLSGES